MSTLASSVKYLNERGIIARQVSPHSLSCERDGDTSVSLHLKGEKYYLEHWDRVPGPGEDDFSVQYNTLDDALLSTWCFFFAKPVNIGGWLVPFHRHPYWSLAEVQYRLANIGHLTSIQFQTVQDERRRRATVNPKNPTIGERFADTTQFLACVHETKAELCLMLRRDLEEGYVVENVA